MATRRHVKRPAPATPAKDPGDKRHDELLRMMAGIAVTLDKINALLEKVTQPLRRQTLDELDPPAPGHLIGPSTEPGGAEEFISGRWHRRAGDVYARVAEPGSPNAGDTDDGKAS